MCKAFVKVWVKTLCWNVLQDSGNQFAGFSLESIFVTVQVTYFICCFGLPGCKTVLLLTLTGLCYVLCHPPWPGWPSSSWTWGCCRGIGRGTRQGDWPAVASYYYEGLGEGSSLLLFLHRKSLKNDWRRWAEQDHCNDKDLNGDTMTVTVEQEG